LKKSLATFDTDEKIQTGIDRHPDAQQLLPIQPLTRSADFAPPSTGSSCGLFGIYRTFEKIYGFSCAKPI
jgi:hypothetical protein